MKKHIAMKNIIKSLAVLSLLTFGILITNSVFADPPAPPPPGGHGSGENQDPAGAPIDGGLGILLALGAGYGAKKLYKLRKEKEESEEAEVS